MRSAEGVVLYVGKAKLLKNRVRSYFRSPKGLSRRIQMMVALVADIEWHVTANEAEALVLENSHIKSLRPKFNILFRDDKSYPYLRFSREEFPRISIYRGRSKRIDDCFGPYPSAGAVHESMTLMQKVFLLRTCDDSVFRHRSRACLLHQIKRCSAPCVGHINAEDYQTSVNLAKRYIQGHQPEVFERIERDMQEASKSLQFERAAELRDQLHALRVTSSTQRIIGSADDFCDCVVVIEDDAHEWFALSFRAIRAGEPVEEHSVALPNKLEATMAEVIAEYLRHRYALNAPSKKIWVNVLPSILEDDKDDDWLKSLPIAKPKRTREKEWLLRLMSQAKITLESEKNSRQHAQSTLEHLQTWLALPKMPLRMECVDISHLAGEGTVGSWVVFSEGLPLVRDYRRYHLKTQGGDDYGAMREIVRRRFSIVSSEININVPDSQVPIESKDEKALSKIIERILPDVLVIDGGHQQIAVVMDVIRQSEDSKLLAMPVIGLSKGKARIEGQETIVFPDGRELSSSLDKPAFKLLLALRDEAHRFALTGQRALRKKQNHSHLEDLEGIGPTRRRRLIARFGSLAGVRSATLEQLQQVEGISEGVARKIYEGLR